METIIAAGISAFSAIVVCLISSHAQNKKIIAGQDENSKQMLAKMDKHNELQAYQIQELTKQVEKHNKVIERVYQLEKEDEVEKEQIKVINHRIEDLESYHK
jgi:formiminotetrahydrofolate cyclodeaminase